MEDLPKTLSILKKEYEVLSLLGKGKGGYSYLVKDEQGNRYVLKQIHHEPCSYYQFGNKIESELKDYETLFSLGIKMPKLLKVDKSAERLLKEYIDGPTIANVVELGQMKEDYLIQVEAMCLSLYKNNLNIDYYPTNFIVQDEVLYYIDYECNSYMEEWDFEHWGKQYWKK